MPYSSDDTLLESRHPPLVAPAFTSQIPEHLMVDASPSEKHMMAQLSVLTQFSAWSIQAHVSTMESVRETNGGLIRAKEDIRLLKEDKQTIRVGWKVIAAVVGGVGAILALGATIYSAVAGK